MDRPSDLRPKASPVAAFWGMFAAALAIRWLALFALIPSPPLVRRFGSRFGSIADGYHEIALQLLQGHGFALDAASGPTAARPPLYPWLLAAVYRLFGTAPTPVVALNGVFGALACALLFLLGRRLYGTRVGLVAGALLALHPWQWWRSQFVLPDLLIALLATLAALELTGFLGAPSARTAIRAGASSGLLGLVNPVMLLTPAFAFAGVAAVARGRRMRFLRHAAVVALAAGLVVAPWTARNAARFHQLIPVNWGLGFQSLLGSELVEFQRRHPAGDFGEAMNAGTLEIARRLHERDPRGRSPGELQGALQATWTVSLSDDAWLMEIDRERAGRDPWHLPRKLLVGIWLFWWFTGQSALLVVGNVGLLAAAIPGLAALRRGAAGWWVAPAMCLATILAYSMVISCGRYSAYLHPFLALFAAVGLDTLVKRRPRRSP